MPDLQAIVGGKDPVELAQRFEAFKAAIDVEWKSTMTGETRLAHDWSRPTDGIGQIGRLIDKTTSTEVVQTFVADPRVRKALSADTLASVQSQITQYRSLEADIVKDFTTTSPLASGLVPFDLEAPAKLLAPVLTPLRNVLPRQRGQGLTRRYKRILGFTGSRTGGAVGNAVRIGITENTQTNWNLGGSNNLYLIRGPKVSYATDDQTVNYKQLSVSDQVSWEAQFAGQGFQDIRQLSQFVCLSSHMLGEESYILGGRGTDSMFVGALAAPAAFTVTARAAVAGEAGYTGTGTGGTNVYVQVTSQGIFGESTAASTQSANIAAAAVDAVDVVITTDSQGALGYNVYAAKADTNGADPGTTSHFFCGRTGWNTFTIFGTGNSGTCRTIPTTGNAVPTGDTSANAGDYDGMLSILGGPNSGYNKRLNAALSTSNPGVEFQAAFLALWRNQAADPEDVWMEAGDSAALSDLLKTSGSSSGFRVAYQQSDLGSAVIGSIVTGILNQSSPTRKMVDIKVHRFIPQGNAMILSWTLPIPNSMIPSCWEMTLPQDYMSVAWPQMQFSWDTSTYSFGALVGYAPGFSGLIQGIKPTGSY